MRSTPNLYVTVNLSKIFKLIPYVEETKDGYTITSLSEVDKTQKQRVFTSAIELLKKSRMFSTFSLGEYVHYREPRGLSHNPNMDIRTEMIPKVNLLELTKEKHFNQEITLNINGLILLMIALSLYKFLPKKERYLAINPFYELYPEHKEDSHDYEMMKSNIKMANYSGTKKMKSFIRMAEQTEAFYQKEQFDKDYLERLDKFITSKVGKTYFKQYPEKYSIHDIHNPGVFLFVDFLFEVLSKESITSFVKNKVNPLEAYILKCCDKVPEFSTVTNNMMYTENGALECFNMLFTSEGNDKKYSLGSRECVESIVDEESLMQMMFEQKMWSKEDYIVVINQFCKALYTTYFQADAERYSKENEQLIFEILSYVDDLKYGTLSETSFIYNQKINSNLKEVRDTLRSRDKNQRQGNITQLLELIKTTDDRLILKLMISILKKFSNEK